MMLISIALLLSVGFLLFQWLKQTALSAVPAQPSTQSVEFISPHPEHNDIASISTLERDYYAKRLGELQAESIRIKAITEQLASMSGIDLSAFQAPEPLVGGIESSSESLSDKELKQELAELKDGLSNQRGQLTELQRFLLTQSSIESSIPSGKPVQQGWVSSYYGRRIDPFTGKKAYHRGIDVAGREGTGVIAVAAGLVTWVGKRGGYGGLVEVDHGNGYVTRYAHNKTISVSVGDMVEKGQVIALMGSTGRSTGPHVHFEILHNGKNVNPYSFVKK
jgi:murein DD-endopeptidase MepM/ murein hydrolase activator NlpD